MNWGLKWFCWCGLLIIAGTACAGDRATWYGENYRGKLMANGKPFNPDVLSAASWHYPLGTQVEVSHNGKSIRVEITDRGGKKSPKYDRTIDLSRAAFAELTGLERGSIPVEVAVVKSPLKHPRD